MKVKNLIRALPIIALAIQAAPVNGQQKTDTQKTESRSSINIRNITTDDSGESSILYTEDGHRHKIRMKDAKILEMYVDDKKLEEKDFSKYDATVKKILAQLEKDREQAEKDRQQAEKDRHQADRDRESAEVDRQQAEKDREYAAKGETRLRKIGARPKKTGYRDTRTGSRETKTGSRQ